MRNMKLYFLLGFCWCVLLPNNAQKKEEYTLPKSGTFVIQGNARNVSEKNKSFRLAVCDPFGNKSYEILLQKDGSFQKTIPIIGMQDIYLYLGDAVTVFSYPGDTLQLTFDCKNCPASVHLSASTPERTREHELSLELYRKFRRDGLNLQIASWDMAGKKPGADSVMLAKIRAYVTNYRTAVQDFVAVNGTIPHEDYFLYRGYFTGLMWVADDSELLSDLLYTAPGLSCFIGEKRERMPLFRNPEFNPFQSNTALKFMQFYFSPKINRLLNLWTEQDPALLFHRKMKIAQAAIPNKSLCDWFLSVEFRDALGSGKLKADKVSETLGKELQTALSEPLALKSIKEDMELYFGVMGKGQPAPDFTLRNEKGEAVSLSDLKGKVVYIDFWSDGCGPCISEFGLQDALHQKYEAYKNQIAYVYICVGSSDTRWKEMLEKYALKGVLLHAQSTKDGGLAPYNINFFPFYVLIDKDGKIAEYNTVRPSNLMGSHPNLLDKLLK